MKNIDKKENYIVFKVLLVFCFLPFFIAYYLVKYFFKFLIYLFKFLKYLFLMLINTYKKHKEKKLEKVKQEIIEEIERRYEKFPLKNRFTQEEIIWMIIQDMENELEYRRIRKIQEDREFVRRMVVFMWN